jgi:putative ABC transport system permease protein
VITTLTIARRLAALTLAVALLAPASVAHGQPVRRPIAIDARLSSDAALDIGDTVLLGAAPGVFTDTAVVAAITKRRADPSEIARGEYRVRLQLDHLQQLIGYGDRVDRFAVRTKGGASTDSVLAAIDHAAFGFRGHRSADVAVETSTTFAVVNRFHRAIGVITIVASAIFLLCIMLLKIDERRRDVAALRLMGISARTIVRSVMLEATFIAALGSGLGVLLGWGSAALVNWHYRGVYRTPLAFALVTPDLVLFAIALSLVLGVLAGWVAARRLVAQPPLALLTGRRN